jgi:fatty acid desaturase
VFDSWRVRHNAHHGHPNQHTKDPDMEMPFIATTEALFSKKRGLERLVTRWQAYYYHPLGTLVGITNRLGGLTFFLHNKEKRSVWKFALYLPAIILTFAGPFLLFSPEKAVVVFLVVHLSSGIYLANCFAPNHKGMQQLPADAQMSFFEQQVVTARNVRGGFLTDLVLVGLNRQIEHHLFPSTPRNKLHLLTPYVLEACRDTGTPYTEVSFIETNRFLLRHLSAIANRPAKVLAVRETA